MRGLIALPLESLRLQLHSTFTPNACLMKASKRISWAIVSRIAAGIAWPCRWQSQEQLSPRHWCSPMPQDTVADPGYGQSVLIPAPPKRRHVALPPCPLRSDRDPCTKPRIAVKFPAGWASRSTNVPGVAAVPERHRVGGNRPPWFNGTDTAFGSTGAGARNLDGPQ